MVKNLPEDTDIDRLPAELWLGKHATHHFGELKVFRSELEAMSWAVGSNPFSEPRQVWRVTVAVQEAYQSAAAVKKWE